MMSENYDIENWGGTTVPEDPAGSISGEEYRMLKQRLAASKFRSRFRLGERELLYLARRGRSAVAGECRGFLIRRLAPAQPRNDGRQTPMRGHPCFVAQHATGCCCRGCLSKWHHIPTGRELTGAELDRLTAILVRWIDEHSAGIGELPYTPDLF